MTKPTKLIGLAPPANTESVKLNVEIEGEAVSDLDIACEAYAAEFGVDIDRRTLAGEIVKNFLKRDTGLRRYKKQRKAGQTTNGAVPAGAAASRQSDSLDSNQQSADT